MGERGRRAGVMSPVSIVCIETPNPSTP
jgi:hypothetical protein